jgi:hypothetical protein
MTAAEFRQVIDIDLNVRLFALKLFTSMMKKGSGKIIKFAQ